MINASFLAMLTPLTLPGVPVAQAHPGSQGITNALPNQTTEVLFDYQCVADHGTLQ